MRIESAHIPQEGTWDCGGAAMLMTHRIIGDPVPNRDAVMRELRGTPERGVSTTNLERYVAVHTIPYRVRDHASLEILAQALRHGWDSWVTYQSVQEGDTEEMGTIRWDPQRVPPLHPQLLDGHYGMVIGLDRTTVRLLDPAMNYSIDGLPTGVRAIPHDIFLNRWIDVEEDRGVIDRWCLSIPVATPSPAAWAKQYLQKHLL